MESPASLRHSPRTAKHSTVQQPLENNSSTVAMELRSPRTGIWRKSGTSSTSANIHTSDAPPKSAMAKSPKSPLAPLKATVAISQSEEAHSRAFNAQSDQQYQQQQHQLRQRHRSASSERPERANSRQRPFITRPLINTDIDTLVPPPEVVTTATQNKQQQTSASTEKSLLEVEVEVDIDALFDSDVSSPPPSWYANTGDGTSVSALGDDAALDDDLRQMQLPFDDIMMAKLRRSVAKKLKADHEDMLGGINITGGMNNAVSNAGNGGDKKRLKIGAGGNGRSLPPRIGDPAEYNPQSNNE